MSLAWQDNSNFGRRAECTYTLSSYQHYKSPTLERISGWVDVIHNPPDVSARVEERFPNVT